MTMKQISTSLVATTVAFLLTFPLLQGQFTSGSPNAARLAARAEMEAAYNRVIKPNTDLEAMALIADRAVGLAGSRTDRFMHLMNGLILDTPPTPAADELALLAGPWSRAKQRIHAHLPWIPGSPAPGRFGSSGFYVDDKSNQVQHVWYSVAVAYRWGAGLADLGARFHEWNGPGLLRHLPGTGRGHGSAADLALSRQGIALGRALAEGTITPAETPAWLRENLGPTS
jgi:hypothetical protein